MDCRKTWLLTLALLLGGLGCVQSRLPSMSSDRNEAALAQRSPNDKKACANLYLAQGRLQEGNSAQENVPPQNQQLFREQARQSFQKALDAEPKHPEALVSLARLSAAEGDRERARQYLNQATQYHPQSAGVWYEVGIYHCKRKEWQPALDSLSKAHHLEPDNREITKTYGFTLARAGRTDQAVTCLSKVMGPAQAHLNVGGLLAHMNQPEQSKQQLRAALRCQPNLVSAQEMLARLEGGPPSSRQAVVTVGFEQPAGD